MIATVRAIPDEKRLEIRLKPDNEMDAAILHLAAYDCTSWSIEDTGQLVGTISLNRM